jgi:hypothetical protein
VPELVETPVTGIPGKRTPREDLELPVTGGRETEVTLLLDISGSNNEQASPDSPTTKAAMLTEAIPLIVSHLEALDSQAAREQAGGSADKGGVLTIAFNEPGVIDFKGDEDESDDYRFIGDLNSANVQEKLAGIQWEGRTFIMPSVRASEHAFQAEFGDRPLRNRPANLMLVLTDGKISDEADFETWLAQADETEVIAVAVTGFGPGHDEAVEHYQRLAQGNRYITVDALTGVSDPAEVAFDLMMLAGKTPAAS